MVKKRLIPCLDVTRGRVVKGVRFVDLRDIGDPVEMATRYSELGADELVFLDITASVHGHHPIVELVERAATELEIPFTVGGGITTLEHARTLLRTGADKVAINSGAVERPALLTELAEEFGSQAVVCAIDSRRVDGRLGEVVTYGARRPQGLDTVEWAREVVERGAGEIMLTSIDADGTRAGYDLEITRAVADAVTVPVIASGGAGEVRHLAEAFEAGAEAALVASITHEAPERIPEIKRQLKEAGWPIRI
ncbi:MAG: imidazole glycerol phosphate synthase subunit HisF [Gaiellaceae bacterium]